MFHVEHSSGQKNHTKHFQTVPDIMFHVEHSPGQGKPCRPLLNRSRHNVPRGTFIETGSSIHETTKIQSRLDNPCGRERRLFSKSYPNIIPQGRPKVLAPDNSMERAHAINRDAGVRQKTIQATSTTCPTVIVRPVRTIFSSQKLTSDNPQRQSYVVVRQSL